MSSAMRRACANVVAVPYFGAGSPAAFSTSPNAPRSSARSMASGGVPTIGTPASASRCASPSGVWPPSCTITPMTPGPPSADWASARKTSSTSSKVSGSKYSRSAVS